MSMVHLHSGANNLLKKSFLLQQYTTSNVSGGLWSSPGKHFLECCRAVLSRPFEWPECQHWMAFQCLFQSCEKGKNRKVTKSGEYGACRHTVIWYTDKNSLMGNTVCGHALLCWQYHFPAAHIPGQLCRMLSCMSCCTPLFSLTLQNKFLVHYTFAVIK